LEGCNDDEEIEESGVSQCGSMDLSTANCRLPAASPDINRSATYAEQRPDWNAGSAFT